MRILACRGGVGVGAYQRTLDQRALDKGKIIFDLRKRDLWNNVTSLHFRDVVLNVTPI
jgi:hypothetical protein